MRLMTALLASALLVSGCGDVHTPGQTIVGPSTPAPTPGAQAKLVLNASSRTDQQLDVTAQLLDGRGVGIPNVDVQFTITGGTVTPAIVKTDATGGARSIALTSGQATLTATTGALTSTTVVIGGVVPVAVTLTIPSVIVGTASTLSASVTSQPIGGAFTFAWTFGDGTTDASAGASTTHTYAKSGTYSASVKVMDGSGRTATGINTAIVNDPPPPPPAQPPAPAPTLQVIMTCAAGTVAHSQACNISATYGSAQIASNKISVSWDWGDGQVDPLTVSPNGTRTYVNAGTYLVIAHVTADATAANGPSNATALTSTSVKVS